MFSYTVITLVVLGILILSSAIKVLREYERAVIFRLGRVIAMKGPGLILLIRHRQDGPDLAPDRGHGRAAAGRDHA